MPSKGYKQSWKQNQGNAYSFAWQSGHTATLLVIKLYINTYHYTPLSPIISPHIPLYISYIRTSIFPSTPITPLYSHLIGVLEHLFYDFPTKLGNVIIPTDFHSIIFQRGRVGPHQPAIAWMSVALPGKRRTSGSGSFPIGFSGVQSCRIWFRPWERRRCMARAATFKLDICGPNWRSFFSGKW